MNRTARASLCGVVDGALVVAAVLLTLFALDGPSAVSSYFQSAWWISALITLFVAACATGYADARAQLAGDRRLRGSIRRGAIGGLSLALAANLFMMAPSLAFAVEGGLYPFTVDAAGRQVLDWIGVGEYVAVTLVVGASLGIALSVPLAFINRLLLKLLPS